MKTKKDIRTIDDMFFLLRLLNILKRLRTYQQMPWTFEQYINALNSTQKYNYNRFDIKSL